MRAASMSSAEALTPHVPWGAFLHAHSRGLVALRSQVPCGALSAAGPLRGASPHVTPHDGFAPHLLLSAARATGHELNHAHLTSRP